MSETWKKQDRPCQPCADCADCAELYEKFWGNGGWAKTDKATDRAHGPDDCVLRAEVSRLQDTVVMIRRDDSVDVSTMRALLSEARIRLDHHLGMCACPGEACVSTCRECNTTQDLINRIRTFMRGKSA
jgi:hypothetical protein